MPGIYLQKTEEIFYKKLLKPLLFKIDPEKVHDRMTSIGKKLGGHELSKKLTSLAFNYQNQILRQEIKGITFNNPIGLAAGFDKNAELTQILPAVGFGFEEVGSITGEYCAGNPQPRLWRHPEKQSLRVYYGLKNEGAMELSKKLAMMKFDFPIGISIAKTNCLATVETDAAIRDYLKSYHLFKKIGDYDTINISCPNAFGGQPFTSRDRLSRLFKAINIDRGTKPIFIKVSPDLSLDELHDLAEVAKEQKVDGLICSNLTKKHEFDKGGLSGKSVDELADRHLRYLRKNFKNDFVLIACGGVFTAQDAYRKIKLGASLIQMITGMIYCGPQTIGQINRGLVELLRKDGFSKISDAVGVDIDN